MATPNLTQHRQEDSNLRATLNIGPADASTVYTAGVDTRSGGKAITVAGSQTVDMLGNAALHEAEAVVRVDATTTLVNTKSLTLALQDSDDNSSFADIAGITSQVVTGTAGNVSALTDLRWMLPSAVRRYVRASCTCPADAGTNTAFYFTLLIVT